MTAPLVEIVSQDTGNRLVMTEAGVSVTGRKVDLDLRWEQVTRVRYSATDNYRSAAYQGTRFVVGVGDDANEGSSSLWAKATGFWKPGMNEELRGEQYRHWRVAVDLLDDRVCVPLLTRAVAAVRAGQQVELAGLVFDQQGVHKKGRLSTKTIPWPEVAGTQSQPTGYLALMGHKGDKTVRRIEVLRDAWNVVLLQRMLGVFAPNMAR